MRGDPRALPNSTCRVVTRVSCSLIDSSLVLSLSLPLRINTGPDTLSA